MARMVEPRRPGWPKARSRLRRSVARDGAGRPLATTALTGPDPFTMTESLLAWCATRAADPEAGPTPGAHGPVVAFGLDPLTLSAAEAGIHQAAEWPGLELVVGRGNSPPHAV